MNGLEEALADIGIAPLGEETTLVLERLSAKLTDRQVARVAAGLQAAEKMHDGLEAALQTVAPDERGLRESLHLLNARYSVVKAGGKALVLDKHAMREEGQPVLHSFADFRNLYRNQTFKRESGKPACLPDEWINWEDRSQYEGFSFEPGRAEGSPHYLNLWQGWGVEPNEDGDCTLFLRHLLENVCGGEREHFDWLLDWIAHLFQYPMEKPDRAIALQGAPGVGKTSVGQVLGHLIGDAHYFLASLPNHVFGNFNAHMETALLLQCEEAVWAGSKKNASRLKHLVTSDRDSVERKFVDAVMRPNYTRLLFTSNERWMLPVEADDRRFAVFHVEPPENPTEYFNRMFAQLEAGGYGRLLHELLKRDVDRETLLREPAPATEALREQAALSMSPEEAWLTELLETGSLQRGRRGENGSVFVLAAALYRDYCESLPSRYDAANAQAFGVFLSNETLFEKTGQRKRGVAGGKRVQSYEWRLLPLAECREHFSSRGRAAATWDAEDDAAWSIENEGVLEFDE